MGHWVGDKWVLGREAQDEAKWSLREYEQRSQRKVATVGAPKALATPLRALDRGEGFAGYEAHLPRVAVPKSKLSEERLLGSGFSPALISIPEPGQARFMSWRHPDGYHAHDHGEAWVIHKDKHSPSALNPVRTIEHIVTEGAPGAVGYIKHQLGGGPGLLDMMQNPVARRPKSR